MTSRCLYLVMAIGLISGCTANRSSGNTSLSPDRWHAIEIDGRPAVTVGATQRPWIGFDVDSGRVSGFGGCNRFSGSYAMTGSSLKFGAMAMTRMACGDAVLNAQESAFAAALHDTDNYVISADTLTLLQATTRRARLVR